MPSQLFVVTVQAALLSGLSNALAQGFTAFRQQNLSSFNPTVFLHFVLFSIFSTPLNYLWQLFLESTFPAKVNPLSNMEEGQSEKTKTKEGNKQQCDAPLPQPLHVTNTAVKFVLDQSLGASVNTVLFLCFIGMFRNMNGLQILQTVRESFWPMMLAGYKVWPVVTLLNLTVVPVEYRMLVGNCVGLVWGVYVSLAAC